jgi:hypothetical protein
MRPIALIREEQAHGQADTVCRPTIRFSRSVLLLGDGIVCMISVRGARSDREHPPTDKRGRRDALQRKSDDGYQSTTNGRQGAGFLTYWGKRT